MPNRLAAERSPYLLQHAGNPVDWFPWGEEAFERARREDKPIFLSIGYSTCHWCHVMEHESFESEEVADALGRDFVSIKVDREERPDVDRVYMTFVQATTGAGGWPMSVWLTPDLKPFFGGTYFPPVSKWGRPGFVDILREIGRMWRADRAKIVQSADTILDQLRASTGAAPSPAAGGGPGRAVPDVAALEEGVAEFGRAFDRRRGGFGEAPKFPRPSEALFLLREFARTGDHAARTMAVETLRAMALGGMRDHVGGGFHRYSVDADWRVPHFEKMLYDQAQLAMAYLEAAQATQDDFHAAVAEDTLDYVLRDLSDPAGGFHSAEDADSVPPEQAGDPAARKTEGAFYLWSASEVDELLGADAEIVRLRFGIEPGGNAPHDPQGEFTLKNLLYTARTIEEVSRQTGRSEADVRSALARARVVLFEARRPRPRPHLDDKVLTAWNGLAIAALARAARTLEGRGRSGSSGETPATRYLEAARRAARFIRQTMWNERTGVLLRRYREGDAAIIGYSEDYAYLIWGLLELLQADGDPAWLEWALRLQKEQDARFWDPLEGGWFNTTGADPTVLLRLKEDYDGAEPSASSVSVMNLLFLTHLTGDDSGRQKLEMTLARPGSRMGRLARAVPMMMAAVSTYHAGVQQIVIAGRRDAEDTQAMRREVARHYLPAALVLGVDDQTGPALARMAPFVGAMRAAGGRATAHVCRDFVCREPVTAIEDLERQLGRAEP